MSQVTSFRATDPEFGQWRNRTQNKQNGSIFTQINGTFCQLQSLRIRVFAHAMILFAKKLYGKFDALSTIVLVKA